MKSKTITHFEYRVRSGDTLTNIIHKLHGIRTNDPRFGKTKASLLSRNPQITNPDFIITGTTIRVALLSETTKPMHSPTEQSTQRCIASDKPFSSRVHDKDWDNYWALAWLEHNHDYVSMPLAVGFSTFGNLMSEGNKQLMTSIGESYSDYTRGKLTKGQYAYARQAAINKLKANVGPAEKILFGNKTPNEALRIARAGGIPATAKIAKYGERMDRIAKFTKYGGYLLYGVNGIFAYEEIEHTTNVQKKNDIAINAVVSTSVGLFADAAIDLVLFSNPVGWVAALALAVGTAAVSYGAGKGAVEYYNRHGHHYNFVQKIGAEFDKLWQHL